jgi:hypothetical protein
MESSEKILLAICIVSAIFLSTNLLLVPLLRGRRKSSDASALKAAQSLLRRPHSKDAQAMEELAQSVERFKREKDAAGNEDEQTPKD